VLLQGVGQFTVAPCSSLQQHLGGRPGRAGRQQDNSLRLVANCLTATCWLGRWCCSWYLQASPQGHYTMLAAHVHSMLHAVPLLLVPASGCWGLLWPALPNMCCLHLLAHCCLLPTSGSAHAAWLLCP
jgi:hypothetical protein